MLELNRQLNPTRIMAYAPRMVPRFGREKANAELGNIAAESMADRRGVQADFALTNTLGVPDRHHPRSITRIRCSMCSPSITM